MEISGNSSFHTGEKHAVRAVESVKIGEGVEITGALAHGTPLINNGLIHMPAGVTEEYLKDALHYYGGGTVKLGAISHNKTS